MIHLDRYKAEWVLLADIDYSDKTYQYRRHVSAQVVSDLITSFKETGQMFQIIVRWMNDGRKQIVCGFRRYTAAKELGWERILTIIVPESELTPDDAEKLSVDENVKRKSLNNMDIMFMCKKLSDIGKTNDYIGELIGKSETQVRRYIKVASASDDVHDKIRSGELSVKEVGDTTKRPGGGKSKMFVKSIKNGFAVNLKFNRKKDDIDKAMEFVGKVLEMLKNEKQSKAQ
jgi:ParB/RepB/Spo0J family partition protein